MTQQIQVLLWKDGRNSNIQFLSSWKRLEGDEPESYNQIEQREGFVLKTVEYEYKCGVSKFGLWLSRKKMGVSELQAVATTVTPMEDKPEVAAIQELTYAINSLVLATFRSSETKGNLVKGSIFTNLHFVYFIQHISHNIGWKVKRFSRCLLRFRASSSVHWTIKLWSYTPTIIFCAVILIFTLERCMRRHPSWLI